VRLLLRNRPIPGEGERPVKQYCVEVHSGDIRDAEQVYVDAWNETQAILRAVRAFAWHDDGVRRSYDLDAYIAYVVGEPMTASESDVQSWKVPKRPPRRHMAVIPIANDRLRAAAMMRDVWPETWLQIDAQAKTIQLNKMAEHFAKARTAGYNQRDSEEPR